MTRLSPQQIVGGFNRRESNAISWIYKEYYSYVAGLARRLTGNSADVEDLAQDIFLKLFMHPGRFEKLEKIRHFLHTTTRNSCLDHLKHQQVISGNLEEIAYQQPFEEESLLASETMALYQQLLYGAIEKLSPQSRQVFLLWYTEELPNREIAKRLGISEKTVANHKTKALKFLKAEMLKMSRYFLLLLYFLQ